MHPIIRFSLPVQHSLAVIVPHAQVKDSAGSQLGQPLVHVFPHGVVVFIRLIPQSKHLQKGGINSNINAHTECKGCISSAFLGHRAPVVFTSATNELVLVCKTKPCRLGEKTAQANMASTQTNSFHPQHKTTAEHMQLKTGLVSAEKGSWLQLSV